MNQTLQGILIVYVIATLFYIINIIYFKYKKHESVDNILEYANNDIKENYNKLKKKRTIILIIGVLIGLSVLIFFEPKQINKVISTKIVSDINDINVIS
jgi:hypothetical protein